MPDELVKVHDVAQEYWYIDRTPCSCGESFRKQMQMLQARGGTPIDCLVTNCDKCGSVREFLFDISAFHGPAITVENMHLARLAEGGDGNANQGEGAEPARILSFEGCTDDLESWEGRRLSRP